MNIDYNTEPMKEGYLGIILGPMFSGKTTKLIELYNTYTDNDEKVAVINYSQDKRYTDTMLSSHDKVMIPCIFASKFSEITILDDENIILINEGQFFEDLYDFVIDMVENKNKSVFVCGLDGDYKRQKFGGILDLIPLSNSVTKLNATCNCGTKALFSHRITDEKEQVIIGSTNYVPLCRSCYTYLNT